MASPVYPGQRILVEVKFFLLGVPTDPTVARCLIKDPTGSTTILTYPDTNFTRRDLGFFEANVTVDRSGTWMFRGEASGVVDAADEAQLMVSSSNF
jgi:hypothetical protein